MYTKRLDVLSPVGAAGKVGQVELDLIPALGKPHGHGADKHICGAAEATLWTCVWVVPC